MPILERSWPHFVVFEILSVVLEILIVVFEILSVVLEILIVVFEILSVVLEILIVVFEILSVVLEIFSVGNFLTFARFLFCSLFAPWFAYALCNFENSTPCASMLPQRKVPHELLGCVKGVVTRKAHVRCDQSLS